MVQWLAGGTTEPGRSRDLCCSLRTAPGSLYGSSECCLLSAGPSFLIFIDES